MLFSSNKEKRSDLQLFTIYDSKTMSYRDPTFGVNEHDLVREVINFMKNPQNRAATLFQNAEDYSIFKIGSFDRSTGLLDPVNLTHIANVHDLKAIAVRETPSQQDLGIAAT